MIFQVRLKSDRVSPGHCQRQVLFHCSLWPGLYLTGRLWVDWSQERDWHRSFPIRMGGLIPEIKKTFENWKTDLCNTEWVVIELLTNLIARTWLVINAAAIQRKIVFIVFSELAEWLRETNSQVCVWKLLVQCHPFIWKFYQMHFIHRNRLCLNVINVIILQNTFDSEVSSTFDEV